jgi:hypothetical protein
MPGLVDGVPDPPAGLTMACRRCAQVLAEPTVEPDAPLVTVVRKAAEALSDDRPVPLVVALHECGHLVVQWICGGPKLVSVMARSTGGSTLHESPLAGDQDPAALRSRVHRAIVGTLAGAEVDARNGGLGWRIHRADVLLVDSLLATIGHDGGHDAALAPLRLIAREAVRDAWSLIAPLATVLQAEHMLEGEPVIAFLEGNAQAQELRWFYGRAFATPTHTAPPLVGAA